MTHTRSATSASTVAHALDDVDLGAPHGWRGLTVFPLYARTERASHCDSFGAALAAGTFRITEVSAAGVVARLRAVNEGVRPVLLLDGEEVLGAKQNRVFDITIVVPAGTTVDIPVSCVEQGRWYAQSQAFRESGRALFARGRARKARDVTASLRTSGVARADQQAVWADVAEQLDALHVESGTRAIGDAYDAHATNLHDYAAALAPEARQCGAVFAVAGDVLGLELFDTAAAYAAAAPKLVRSYAFELLNREPAKRAPDAADAARLIEDLRQARVTEHAAVGAGTHVRFDEAHLTGGGLQVAGTLVHLFAFRTARQH